MPSATAPERVSVIIPAHNAGQTLKRCLDSVLAQSFPPSEILVHDDCSTDNTFQVASAMAARHPSIRVSRGTVNQGTGHARSRLLQQASGEFFAFLDADDTWHPDKLARQMAAIRAENLDLCVCDYEVRDASGTVIGTRTARSRITFGSMHLANWIPNSMAVVRAGLTGARHVPNLRRRQDYAYWLTILKQNPSTRVGAVKAVLGTYYRSGTGLSSNKMTNLKSNFRMFRETMGYSPLVAALCVGANIVVRIFRT